MKKKTLALLMVIVLCVCCTTPALASEKYGVNDKDASMSRAIGGSEWGEYPWRPTFKIYSSGWSLAGHAEVTVVGDPVWIGIQSPNGNSALSAGGVLLYPGENQRLNLINTVAGTYTITLTPHPKPSGETPWSYVAVTLKDW